MVSTGFYMKLRKSLLYSNGHPRPRAIHQRNGVMSPHHASLPILRRNITRAGLQYSGSDALMQATFGALRLLDEVPTIAPVFNESF